jgi:hypothetical protein
MPPPLLPPHQTGLHRRSLRKYVVFCPPNVLHQLHCMGLWRSMMGEGTKMGAVVSNPITFSRFLLRAENQSCGTETCWLAVCRGGGGYVK